MKKKRLNMMIAPDALAVLNLLATERKRGALITKLLLAEYNRQRCDRAQLAKDAARVADCLKCA